jgi:phosphatidylinositol alpha-1,6-mannosyltransferase
LSGERFKLLATAVDYRPRLGGIATLNYELLSALARIADVRLLAPEAEGSSAYDDSSDAKVIRVKLPKSQVAAFPLASRLAREVLTWKPDAVFNSLWLPEGAASLLCSPLLWSTGTPYYVSAYGVELLETDRSLKKKIRSRLSPAKAAVFAAAKGVLSISHFTSELLERHCGVEREKLILAIPGVDTSHFKPGAPSRDLVDKYDLDGKKVFLSVTRLDDYKGVDHAITAFKTVVAKHPEAVYLVCGGGADRARLEELVSRRDLKRNVIFTGEVEPERLRDYYNLCDAFVLLSREDYETPNVEGFGLVFLEASACGKPSIAGRSGGIPDAVEDGVSGWLVDPVDDTAIAAAMLRVLDDPKGAKQMGESANARAQKMSWDRMAETVLEQMQRRGGPRDVRN